MSRSDSVRQCGYTVVVPAKVNLSLVITGRRGELHTLKSVVCPAYEYEDEVTFIPSDDFGIEVADAYDGFEPERFRTFFEGKAKTILQRVGVTGRIKISKHIPLGAGLGGSSACTAGVILAVRKYSENDKKAAGNADLSRLDSDFLLSLGSDVPAMLKGGACLVEGVGEKVTPIKNEDIRLDIRIAEGGSDSGACYRLYDRLPAPCVLLPEPENISEAIDAERNDLTVAAGILNPAIPRLIEDLRRDYERVIMSGSGSAVVGIVKKVNK